MYKGFPYNKCDFLVSVNPCSRFSCKNFHNLVTVESTSWTFKTMSCVKRLESGPLRNAAAREISVEKEGKSLCLFLFAPPLWSQVSMGKKMKYRIAAIGEMMRVNDAIGEALQKLSAYKPSKLQVPVLKKPYNDDYAQGLEFNSIPSYIFECVLQSKD
ncbi:hypothetical protein L6452_08207 [Arctium lappa]|uniref:Uncharacterized protein n=1 Tax=Arctium lappa TaxID=4217 RepID=A0ACB9DH42_ARCLA|nr:hypothetical protein L6452_08207 [Arctium lappa]